MENFITVVAFFAMIVCATMLAMGVSLTSLVTGVLIWGAIVLVLCIIDQW